MMPLDVITRALTAEPDIDYDFRVIACPDDPLRDRFDEWLSYYRYKYAVARQLTPLRITEIGVRYGYSADAFLSACPYASYVGIDDDSATYGGAPGALEWASEHVLIHTDAVLRRVSSQTLDSFGDCDLLHIDGQQDMAATYHDLSVGMLTSSWMLVDGTAFSAQVATATEKFLADHDLDHAVTREHMGQMLIRGLR